MSRSLGRLTLDLIAKTGSFEQGMDRASRRTRSTTSDLDRAARAAERFARVAATAAAAYAASMAAIVTSTARAMDATSKMAQQVGVTTEALTGMRFAAQQFANISDQQFDMSMRRMTRRIAEAAQGTGSAVKALEQMGLSAQRLSQMTPDKQMLAIADAMQRTRNQADRLRYAMALFDTEGMALVPALQQGARAFEENIALAERYGVVLSTEAARAAEEFTTNMSHLGAMMEGLRMQLTAEVLPTLNQFITNVIDASTEVGGLHSEVRGLAGNTTFQEWFNATLVGLARVADVAVFLAKTIGVVGGAFRAVAADAEVAVAALNKMQAWNWFSDEASAQLQDALKRRNEIVSGFNEDLADLFTYQGNRYEQAALMAVNAQNQVSDVVELAAVTTEGLTDEIDKNTGATKKSSKALTEAQRAAQAFRREQESALRAQYQAVSAIHSQAQAIEDQIAVYGLSKTAIEDLAIARLEERAAALDGAKEAEEQIAIIEREIEARKRLRTAIGSLEHLEAERRAWEAWEREMDTVFQQVSQSLTDAIFEGGKSGRDLLKDLFKTLVLRVAIQPIMGSIQGMVTQQLGGMLGLQQPGGSNILGMAQNASSLYSAASGGLTGNVSNAIGWVGEKIGSTALQSFAAGMVGGMPTAIGAGLGASLGTTIGTSAASMATTTFSASLAGGSAAAGGAAAGLGSALGAALPWVGGALAVGSMFGLFGDRKPTTRRAEWTLSEFEDGAWSTPQRTSRQSREEQDAARQFAEASVEAANRLFEQVGVDAAIDRFYAIMDASILGDRDGVASGGSLRVGDELVDFGIPWFSAMTSTGFGGWSDQPMLPRLQTDIQLSILEAFQAASDALPNVLADMLEGVDIRSLDEAGALDLATRFNAVIEAVTSYLAAIESMPFEQLSAVTFDAAANMIEFAGGLENLMGAQQTYFENFYSEAEQHEHAVNTITRALEEAGLVMPALTGSVEEMLGSYRSLVEAQDLTTESGQRAYVALMQAAGAFSEVAKAAAQATPEQAFRDEHDRLVRAAQAQYQQAANRLQAAYSAVQNQAQRAIDQLQQTFTVTDSSLDAYRRQVRQLENDLGGLLNTLGRAIADLRGNVDATAQAQYQRARAVISTTLATGQLPATADLSEAVRIAQQGIATGRYSSAFEQRDAYMRLANELEALQDIAQPELDTAVASLKQLEKQYNLMRGISDTGDMSLSALHSQLEAALRAEESARQQITTIEQQLGWAERQYNALLGVDDSIKSLSQVMAEFRRAEKEMQKAVSNPISRDQRYLESKLAQLQATGSMDAGIDWTRATTTDLAAVFAMWDMTPEDHWRRYGQYEGLSYNVGTSFVPRDMMASIHRGEIIIDPNSSDILRRYGINVQGGGNSEEVVRAVRELLAHFKGKERQEYEDTKSLKRIAMQTETVERAVMNDDGVLVVAYG